MPRVLFPFLFGKTYSLFYLGSWFYPISQLKAKSINWGKIGQPGVFCGIFLGNFDLLPIYKPVGHSNLFASYIYREKSPLKRLPMVQARKRCKLSVNRFYQGSKDGTILLIQQTFLFFVYWVFSKYVFYCSSQDLRMSVFLY